MVDLPLPGAPLDIKRTAGIVTPATLAPLDSPNDKKACARLLLSGAMDEIPIDVPPTMQQAYQTLLYSLNTSITTTMDEYGNTDSVPSDPFPALFASVHCNYNTGDDFRVGDNNYNTIWHLMQRTHEKLTEASAIDLDEDSVCRIAGEMGVTAMLYGCFLSTLSGPCVLPLLDQLGQEFDIAENMQTFTPYVHSSKGKPASEYLVTLLSCVRKLLEPEEGAYMGEPKDPCHWADYILNNYSKPDKYNSFMKDVVEYFGLLLQFHCAEESDADVALQVALKWNTDNFRREDPVTTFTGAEVKRVKGRLGAASRKKLLRVSSREYSLTELAAYSCLGKLSQLRESTQQGATHTNSHGLSLPQHFAKSIVLCTAVYMGRWLHLPQIFGDEYELLVVESTFHKTTDPPRVGNATHPSDESDTSVRCDSMLSYKDTREILKGYLKDLSATQLDNLKRNKLGDRQMHIGMCSFAFHGFVATLMHTPTIPDDIHALTILCQRALPLLTYFFGNGQQTSNRSLEISVRMEDNPRASLQYGTPFAVVDPDAFAYIESVIGCDICRKYAHVMDTYGGPDAISRIDAIDAIPSKDIAAKKAAIKATTEEFAPSYADMENWFNGGLDEKMCAIRGSNTVYNETAKSSLLILQLMKHREVPRGFWNYYNRDFIASRDTNKDKQGGTATQDVSSTTTPDERQDDGGDGSRVASPSVDSIPIPLPPKLPHSPESSRSASPTHVGDDDFFAQLDEAPDEGQDDGGGGISILLGAQGLTQDPAPESLLNESSRSAPPTYDASQPPSANQEPEGSLAASQEQQWPMKQILEAMAENEEDKCSAQNEKDLDCSKLVLERVCDSDLEDWFEKQTTPQTVNTDNHTNKRPWSPGSKPILIHLPKRTCVNNENKKPADKSEEVEDDEFGLFWEAAQ